jgi:hypothetical protein
LWRIALGSRPYAGQRPAPHFSCSVRCVATVLSITDEVIE